MMFNPINLISVLFKTELENTNKLFPGHDPFSGHRKGDEGAKSTFVEPYDPGTWVEPDEAIVDETIKETDSVKILKISFSGTDTEPGIRMGTPSRWEWTVGVTKETRPKSSGYVTVELNTVHGCMQPVARCPDDWEVVEDEVAHATVVLTKEKAGDGTELWCLASAYPGDPGAGPEQFSGFREGYTLRLAPHGDTADVIAVTGPNGEFDTPEGREIDIRHVVLR